MKKDARVIIAGAGPVGTFAAYFLAEAGLEVIVLEAAPSCMEDMRASTFHPPTLEMMDDIGIAGDLIERGLKAPVYQYRDRQSGENYKFDFAELAGDTRFPFRLQCEQYKMAGLLAEKLDAHPNADMRFRNRINSFSQDESGVKVHVETPYEIETLTADYLIAADGANSIIRKWLGVQFEGFTYPEKFLTLSTTTPLQDYFDDVSYVNYIADPEEWVVLLKVPSVWRVLVPSMGMSDEELLSDENKTKVFDRLIGIGDQIETYHRTIYNVHQRVAEKFNHGRVMLVGDAAHLNNPLGGFGMNSGIHDAESVGQALIKIYKGGGDPDKLFNAFDAERRAITHEFIQRQTIRNKKMMEANTAEAQKAYSAELKAIQQDDRRRREFLLNQSMLRNVRLKQAA
jgi:3-(3-hydroxy-phenyl)propionate hydroxylase